MNSSRPLAFIDSDTLRAVVDTSIYSISAVFATCYKYTDHCYIFLSRSSDPSSIEILFSRKNEGSDLSRVAAEFYNELIDQQIRIQVNAETAQIRTLIVAQAFSEGNLLDVSQQVENYQDDPHGIRHNR